jgi:hypothetical protein
VRDVVLGLLAIAVGALFCFRGYLTMRFVIPVWGAFAGFALGAGVVDGITGDGFLVGALAWVVGLVVALVFAVLAYFFYEVSVLLAMSSVGFVLGSSLMMAIGVTWSWLVVLTGVVVGMALAVLAIIGSLPMVLLTLLTALAGSAALVGGIMLVTGSLNAADLDSATIGPSIEDSPGWWVLYAVIAVVGVVVQLRFLDDVRRSLRAQWAADGGRQLVRTRNR